MLNGIKKEAWNQEHTELYTKLLEANIVRRKEVVTILRSKYMGNKDWSPLLQEIRDERRLWTLIIKKKQGQVELDKKVNKKTGKSEALEASIFEARRRKKEVEQRYKEKDSFWTDQRKKS